MNSQPTMLVVEDDPKNQKIIQQIFSDKYTIVPYLNGEDAVAQYQQQQPDIILLDIMLPGIDGYEVCKNIKADGEFHNTPIVMLSAKTSLDDRLKGYEVGADDYFTKPFDHDELVAKLDKLISYKHSLTNLNQKASEASNIAMQAMTTSSELGQILQFMQSSFNLKTLEEVSQAIFQLTENFGLKVCIQIQDDENEDFTACDSGVVTPLEESILNQARVKGRIFDFRNRTIINYPHISMLIKNMPLDEPERYGLIKDNICFLIEAAEARVKNLFMQKAVDRQRNSILKILQQTTHYMETMSNSFNDLRKSQAGIIDRMMSDIEDLIPKLGLELSQEEALIAITQGTINKTTELFNKGLKLNEEFAQTLKQLEQISNTKGTNNKTFENVLNRLS